MGGLLSIQLDYIFFFYGLSFLLLATTAFYLHKTPGERLSWRWLSLFGLAHGINEWLDMSAFTFSDSAGFIAVRTAVMALSFVFLLEFGRRRSGNRTAFSPAVYLLLLPLSLAGAFYGPGGLNASARYALGMTGGLAAALALSRDSSGREAAPRFSLLAAAAALFLYAFASGAITPNAPFPPASWLNYDSFKLLTGFPVQLLRAFLAIAAAAAAWFYFISLPRAEEPAPAVNRKKKLAQTLTTALLVTLAAGFLLTNWLGDISSRETKLQAETIENVLSNRIRAFTSSAENTAAAMAAVPAIARAFSQGAAGLQQANPLLDNFNASYGLSICYLLNRNGTAIASSNRNTPKSLVGESYSFRPYFRQALDGKLSRYFAVGVTTGERGYYAASPVRGPEGRIEGVAVAKLGIDSLGLELRGSGLSFVVSPEGVIFLASRPELIFRSLWPAEGIVQTSLTNSRQFGLVNFVPVLPSTPEDDETISFEGGEFFVSKAPLWDGWTSVSMQPLKHVRLARFVGILIALSVSLTLIFFFLTLMQAEEARNDAERLLAAEREVENLSGIIPICASCKQIRNDDGYWDKVETYISSHSSARFSHGICPSCLKKLYPQYANPLPDKDR